MTISLQDIRSVLESAGYRDARRWVGPGYVLMHDPELKTIYLFHELASGWEMASLEWEDDDAAEDRALRLYVDALEAAGIHGWRPEGYYVTLVDTDEESAADYETRMGLTAAGTP